MKKHFINHSLFSILFITINFICVPILKSSQDESLKYFTVRSGSDLCREEKIYIDQRKKHVRAKLETLCDTKLTTEHVPTIAICCSGGGFRAMFATLGFISGAAETGLLDYVTYAAFLSGSSWFSTSWILSKKPIELFKNDLLSSGEGGLFRNSKTAINAYKNLIHIKKTYHQPTSLVDLYGCLIANKILAYCGNQRFDVPFSECAKTIDSKLLPFPISTAVYLSEQNEYEWMEFSPYEIGSPHLNTFIPSAAFGKTFHNGNSNDDIPSETTSRLLGIFGNVFSGGLRDLIDHLPDLSHNIKKLTLYKKIKEIVKYSPTCNNKFSPSNIPNFGRGLASCPLNKKRYLTLIDSGFIGKIPAPILLRKERTVDIILVFDASFTKNKHQNALFLAKKQAFAKGLKFPPIDIKKICNETLSIFEDPLDQSCPIVLYLPLRQNTDFDPYSNKFCRSICNFNYPTTQATKLCNFAHDLIINPAHQNTIQEVIKRVIFAKKHH